MGSIEDEYHFLMVCPLYKDYRDNLFNSITCPVINFNEMSNNDKFQYINKITRRVWQSFYKIVGKDGKVSCLLMLLECL